MLAAVKAYAWAGIEAVADVAAEVKSQTVDAAVTIASAARAVSVNPAAPSASATPSPRTPPRQLPTALEAEATANASSPSVKDVVRSFEAKAASNKDKPSSPLKKSARPVIKKQGSFIQRMAQRISPSKGKEQEKPQEPPPQEQQIVITSLSPPAPIMKNAALNSPRATVSGAGASTNGEGNPAAPEPVLVTPPPSSSSSSAEKDKEERGSGSGRAKKTLSGRLLFPLRSPSRSSRSSDSILSSSSSGNSIPAAIDKEGSLSNDGSESPTAASSASGSSVDGGNGGNGSAEKEEGGGGGLSRQGSLGKLKTILKNSDWR